MRKIAAFIVKHKKLIIGFYVLILLLSAVSMQFVTIEYDLSSYLPKEINSIKGKNKLSEDFNIKGTANLMVKEKELYKVKKLKEDIESLPAVESVIWLDDAEDIHKPVDFMDKALSKRFISGEYSLLQLQFAEGNDTLATRKAIDEIDKMTEMEHYIGGQAAVSKDMQDTANRELFNYSVVAFIIITIILLISSRAYYEPILFFAAIGAAILLNMGTNIIFGSISSNTHSVASILQLAVSMDYSIFLLHRFHEEAENMDQNSAMIEAIVKTFSSVSSSALTTVGGFLALVAMHYGIGKDMGLVLAKGVFFSLVTVVTLLPCLILVSERFSGYKHKILLPDFKRISGWMVKRRKFALVLAMLLVLPAFLGQSKLKYYYSTEKTLSTKSQSVKSNEKIEEIFGSSNELILLVPKVDKTKLKSMADEIDSLEKVDSVQGLYSMADETLPDFLIPKQVRATFESDKYTYFILNINAPIEGLETKEIIKKIQSTADKYTKEWYVTGEAAIYMDLQQVTSQDFNRVTIISIIIIGLILLFTFKSLVLSLILVFVIQLGIWINLSIPYFLGSKLNFIAFIIIGAIQLGATVDYAILFTSRYKENLEAYKPLEAMKKTIEDTGRSVFTSALILMAGTFSISFITTIKSASELTLLIGRGAFISLLLVYMLLPALLLIFGPLIRRTTLNWPKNVSEEFVDNQINVN
ncbi:efflux RND transporter permease subunit [Clostridium polynesiense]|uniref:efflux RND transporter permease subunit n=1 Tax=Clostridium polynesiense TaxID=1325933 RepID=UPI00058B1F87|nr:MMPL family transporter [Clostridium polynesiense]